MQHTWIPSTLGHGETMCAKCFVTNREAAAIGMLECDAPPPKPANENAVQDYIDQEYSADDYLPDDDDEMLEAEMNCGKMANGQCSQAGTEYCDWSCPFSR